MTVVSPPPPPPPSHLAQLGLLPPRRHSPPSMAMTMVVTEQDLAAPVVVKTDGPIASWLKKRKSQKSMRAAAKLRPPIPRSTPPLVPQLPLSPVSPIDSAPSFTSSPDSSLPPAEPTSKPPSADAHPITPPKFSNGPHLSVRHSVRTSRVGHPSFDALQAASPARQLAKTERSPPPSKYRRTQDSSRASSEHSRPSTASTAATTATSSLARPPERRPTRSSPTAARFPSHEHSSLADDGSTNLRLPLAFTKLTRDRDLSLAAAATNTTEPPLPSPTLRPSTAGADHHPDSNSFLNARPSTASSYRSRPTGFALGPAKAPPQPKMPPMLDDHRRHDVRASFRSALTTASSYVANSSGTERDSVMTKSSSVSEDGTTYAHGEKAGGMSVDDAISMYANGFDDTETDEKDGDGAAVEEAELVDEDPIEREQEAVDESPTIHLAEAMNGNIGSPPAARPVVTPPTPSPPTNLTRIASIDGHDRPEVEERDRYGFRKHNQYISLQQYERWNGPYTDNLIRRKKKWVALLAEHGLPTVKPVQFPPSSAKVKRYIRKGVPPEWRGAAWFWYAGGHARMQRYPTLYHDLVEQAERGQISENDRELIERDLHRTFPDNIKFKADGARPDERADPRAGGIPTPPLEPGETPTLRALRRVLQAFAIHNPRVGYCQSLNFLAGLLLLFMEEQKAFWMLDIITHVYLPGTHDVSLEGANVDLAVLMTSIQESMPAVWAKIGGELDGTSGPSRTTTRLPPITLCTTAWFMSCFIGTLPIETVLRVWDSFFYESSKTLFRVALAIFKVGEPEIRAVSDPMEIFQVVQTIPRRLIDANALMEACFKRRNGFGHLSQETIDERRRAWRALYARERSITGPTGFRGDAEPSALDIPHPESNADLLAQPLRQGLRRVGSKARLKRIHIRG